MGSGWTALGSSPALYFFDTRTSSSITVQDGDPGDLSPEAGVVSWSGQVGIWTVLGYTSGFSELMEGEPALSLASGMIYSSGAGSLIVRFSDTGFGPSDTEVASSIGGISSGQVKYSVFADPNDNLVTSTVPGTAVYLIGPATVGGSGFSANDSGTIDLALFSLTQAAEITHTAAGQTSFYFSVQMAQVPEPSAPAMLGAGFVALLAARAFRRRH